MSTCDWPKALIAARAAVTQYTIWHLSHTAPRHLGVTAVNAKLMTIDVEALSAHVANLARAYGQLGREDQFLKDLARLTDNLEDARWRRKIAYHRSVAMMVTGDRAGAGEALAEAGPITADEQDIEIIQAHLDLNAAAIGFAEKQRLMNTVVERSKSRADILQYMGAQALQLILINDDVGATALFREAIERAHEMESQKALGSVEEHWLCGLLEGFAVATRDEAVFSELERRWQHLLSQDGWTPLGRAKLWTGLADSYRYWDRWDDALDAYARATEHGAGDAVRIFEAETLAWNGKAEEALELLKSLTHAGFSVAEEADFAFIWYFAAHRAPSTDALTLAITQLRAAETPEPHFEQRRLELLNLARDDLDAIAASRPLSRLSWPMKGIRALSRYAILQPNWNGVGVNFNLMIDDVLARSEGRDGVHVETEDK